MSPVVLGRGGPLCFIISQKVPDSRVVEIPLGSQPMDPRGSTGSKVCEQQR